jgi:hypothetical protein
MAVSGPAQPTRAAQDEEQADRGWSEILALFVDDPRGSVEQALEATQSRLLTVISVLRRQQDQVPAASGPQRATAADTEPLRVALRNCRTFWQDLAELADLLRRPQ